MTNIIEQELRASTEDHASLVLPEGVITINSDTNAAVVHDNTTLGGNIVPTANMLQEVADSVSDVITNLGGSKIELIGNVLRFTDEFGIINDIDLSIYLNTVNPVKIISSTVTEQGVITFNKDDDSSFIIDVTDIMNIRKDLTKVDLINMGISVNDFTNINEIPETLALSLKGGVGSNGADGSFTNNSKFKQVSLSTVDITPNNSIYTNNNGVSYLLTDDGWYRLGKLVIPPRVNNISAGNSHTVFLLSDGTVQAVGYNDYGQLGDGTTTNRSTPVPVSGISNCIGIEAGYVHTVFLLSDGTCKAVGRNNYGELGDGTTTNRSIAVTVSGITNCIGIDASEDHTVFLLSDGTVKAVGSNGSGRLGDGTTTNRSIAVTVSGITNCIGIATGQQHTVFLLSNGTVKAVGTNIAGNLGDGTTTQRTTPVAVSGVTNCISVTAGNIHTVFLLSDGTCKAVGNNGNGINASTPISVSGVTNCIGIESGGDHTVFLLADKTVKTVGSNNEGQLGDGTATSKSTPITVPGITNCIGITADYYHTVFLLSDGTCKAVGHNYYGQLGDGTNVSKRTPVSCNVVELTKSMLS